VTGCGANFRKEQSVTCLSVCLLLGTPVVLIVFPVSSKVTSQIAITCNFFVLCKNAVSLLRILKTSAKMTLHVGVGNYR